MHSKTPLSRVRPVIAGFALVLIALLMLFVALGPASQALGAAAPPQPGVVQATPPGSSSASFGAPQSAMARPTVSSKADPPSARPEELRPDRFPAAAEANSADRRAGFPTRTGENSSAGELRVEANRTHDWVRGDAPAHSTLYITATRGTDVIGTAQRDLGEGTGFFADLRDGTGQTVDFQAGDLIHVEAQPAALHAQLVLIEMDAEVDATADTVTGHVEGVADGADLQIELWGPNGTERQAQTDANGDFTVDFSPFDVEMGDDVAIWYVQPDGNYVGIVRSALQIQAQLTNDDVYGQTTPNAEVRMTLTKPAEQLAGTTVTVWANDEGQYGTQFHDPDNRRIDIAPGDRVDVESNETIASLTIPAFTANYSYTANTVCGQAPAGTEVEVDLWGYGTKYATASAGSTYCVSFSDRGDPQIGDRGQANIYRGDGHRVWVQFGTPSPNLWVSKWADGQPATGRRFRWNLEVGNGGDSSATGVVLTDTLPAGTVFISASTGSPSQVGNDVILHLGDMQPGSQRDIVFTVQVNAAVGSQLNNCVRVATANWEGNTGDNGACDGRQVAPNEVDLSIKMGSEPGDPPPGGVYVYKIYINNERPAGAVNVRITDTLPASVTVLSTWQPAGWTADTSHPGRVVWRAADMPGSSGRNMELRLRVPDTVPYDTQLINVIETGNSIPDVNPDNNRQQQDVWVKRPRVNLWVGKGYESGQPVAGRELRTQIRVYNGGNILAPGTALTDTLPPGTTFVTATQMLWNTATGQEDREEPFPPSAQGPDWVRWNVGEIVPWRPLNVRVTLRIGDAVPPSTALTNWAEAYSSTPDEYPPDNRARYDFSTQPAGPNVHVEKWYDWGQVLPGEMLQYQVNIRNDGTQAANDVWITDTLPAGVTFEGHGWWQNPADVDNKLVWHLNGMNPGDQQGWWIQVHVNNSARGGETLTNSFEAQSATAEVRYDDNIAVQELTVGPDLRVEKEMLEPPRPGREARYRIHVWNETPFQTPAYDVVLTDTLPAGTSYLWDKGGAARKATRWSGTWGSWDRAGEATLKWACAWTGAWRRGPC